MPVCRSARNRPGQAVASGSSLVAAVCLAFFLTLLPLRSAFCRTAGMPQAAATLPYGGNVSRETAQRFVQNESWLAALRQAAGKLESRTVVQLGATTRAQRLALTAAVFSPTFRFSPDSGKAEGELTAVARLAEAEDLPTRLRTALRHPEVLALYAAATEAMRGYAKEGRDLLLRAADTRRRHGPEADHIFIRRINSLENRLKALHIYMTVLEQLRGRWAEPAVAARELRRAVKLDADNALLWCALGEAQLQQDLPQAALESLDKAVALMPGLARARYFRGLTQLRLQQSALAEADLTAALELRPDMPQWLRARGAIRMVREDYGPMCEDFNKACMLGDCDGLEAARKRLQCLPPTALSAAVPENPAADAPLPTQPLPPQEQTIPPEPAVSATAQATPATATPPPAPKTAQAVADIPATPPADASASVPPAPADWPSRPGAPRRSVADSATDTP